MILPKIPKQLSIKLPESNIWVLYDFSNLTFNTLDEYLDYTILTQNVGLIAEFDSPSNVIELGFTGNYLVKNKFDGRLVLYSEDRFRKFYPFVI